MVQYSQLPLNNALAEGIECKEELDFIRTTDVDYLQGYYLGMPE